MPDRIPSRLGRFRLEGLHFELFLGLGLRMAGALSAFAMTWVIARMFGPQVFGHYQLALATVGILAIASIQGLDRLVVRNASASFAKGEPGNALNFFTQARNRQLIIAVPLALVLMLAADPIAQNLLEEPGVAVHLRLLAPAIVGLALIRSCSSLLRAKGSVLISQSIDGVGYTTIAVVTLGVLFFMGAKVAPFMASAVYLAGVVIVAFAGLALVKRAFRGTTSNGTKVALASGLFIAGFNVLAALGDWLGLFLLTTLRDASEAGIYRVGFQICLLFSLVNGSFALMAGPRLATAFDRRDPDAAWQTVRTASLVGIAIVIPLMLLIFLAAEPILALFGEEFVRGADALKVLAIGQFINVAAGPVGAALTMMKRERAVFYIEIATVSASLAILLWLLPTYGMMGAAIAAASAAILRNLASLLILRRELARLA